MVPLAFVSDWAVLVLNCCSSIAVRAGASAAATEAVVDPEVAGCRCPKAKVAHLLEAPAWLESFAVPGIINPLVHFIDLFQTDLARLIAP